MGISAIIASGQKECANTLPALTETTCLEAVMAVPKMRSESLTRKSITVERLRALYAYRPDTGEFIRLFSSGRNKIGGVSGTKTKDGYIAINVDCRPAYAHRLAWLYMTGAWPVKDHVDHINGCRSDNRWANLREADHSQNLFNRGPTKRNTSGFKGVSRRRSGWVANIMARGTLRSFGPYPTREEAASAYAQASQEFHGEFACFSPTGPKS